MTLALPQIQSVDQLEDLLSTPDEFLYDLMKKLSGDILVLGVGGKMGFTLARMARRACDVAATKKKVIGVSSFSNATLREKLEGCGVITQKLDLLEPGAVNTLPDVENIIYMIGRKFGTMSEESKTWATNVFVAGLVGQRFPHSRIVAFSSGNVYPLVPISSGGATESTSPAPVGDYAMSCLGRERMFDYASASWGTKVLHYRLNYAVELRYGVIVDVALKVFRGEAVDLTTGHFNAVWQRYANLVALKSLTLTSSPPRILNVTGPETVSVRWLAERFGKIMEKKPVFTGEESSTALLSNAAQCHRLFGYPDLSVDAIVDLVANWLLRGGEIWDKPTHFEKRNGVY